MSEAIQLQKELNEIIKKDAAFQRVADVAVEARELAEQLIVVGGCKRQTQILSLIIRISDEIAKRPNVTRLSGLLSRLNIIETYAVAADERKSAIIQ